MSKQRQVVGYVRISMDRANQQSTDNQKKSIEAFCTAHGWKLVDILEDKGESGYNKERHERPGQRKAIQMIRAGAADTFVVWQLSRAARDALDLLEFLRDDLEPHGAEFVSVTESFDTKTPTGMAMLTIIAALAQMESAQKSARTLSWHVGRREKGAPPAGRPPLGYNKPVPNTLVPDPATAPVIAGAVDRVIAGESFASVVRWVNGEGVKVSRPGLTTALLMPTIAGLRSNDPIHCKGGKRLPADDAVLLPGSWDAIVEPEKWHLMRAILRDPKRRTNTGVALRWPLVPVLRCGACGNKMLRQNQKQRTARYICRGINDAPGERCLNGITQGPVDEEVTKVVLEHLDDSTWRSLRVSGEASGPDPEKIASDLERLWEHVMDGSVDMDKYVEAKLRWEGELAAATSGEADLPDVDSIRDSWGSLDPLQQSLVYQAAIESLAIGPSTRRGRGVDKSRIQLKLVD